MDVDEHNSHHDTYSVTKEHTQAQFVGIFCYDEMDTAKRNTNKTIS